MKYKLLGLILIASTQAFPFPKPKIPVQKPLKVPTLGDPKVNGKSLKSIPTVIPPKVGSQPIVPPTRPTLTAETEKALDELFPNKRVEPKITPFPRIQVADLPLGEQLGEGGVSAAYKLPNGQVAVIVKEDVLRRAPNERDYMEKAVEYMKSIDTKINGVPVAPKILGYITDADGRIIGYKTMNYGQSLDSIYASLPSGKTLHPEDIIYIQNELKKQLDALHKQGFAHGDLHDGNVIIHRDAEGRVKSVQLIDFDTWQGDAAERMRIDRQKLIYLENLLNNRLRDYPRD